MYDVRWLSVAAARLIMVMCCVVTVLCVEIRRGKICGLYAHVLLCAVPG